MVNDDQEIEMEGLESMYGEAYVALGEGRFHLALKPDMDLEDFDTSQYVALLVIEYPPEYPEVVPVVDVVVEDWDLPEESKTKWLDRLGEVADECVGMAMVFDLANTLQEMLEEDVRAIKEAEDAERAREVAEQEALVEAQRRKEAEEAVARDTAGTPVTVDNFVEWQKKFDAERAAKAPAEVKRKVGKKTGRELFEANSKLFLEQSEEGADNDDDDGGDGDA